jgi:hypothetical protein
MPQNPEVNDVSLAVAIHPAGSVEAVDQTFAERADPTDSNRMVYDVPEVAVNGTLANTVVAPATFFWMTRLAPSM